jgi:hypothetical protein
VQLPKASITRQSPGAGGIARGQKEVKNITRATLNNGVVTYRQNLLFIELPDYPPFGGQRLAGMSICPLVKLATQ